MAKMAKFLFFAFPALLSTLFEQAGELHAYIEARKNIGKVVLVTGD